MDDLIAKFFTQGISPDEQKQLDRWLGESPENRRYLDEIEQIWSKSALFAPKIGRPVDVEAALKMTKSSLKKAERAIGGDANSGKKSSLKKAERAIGGDANSGKKVALFRWWILAAAAVFGGVAASVWLFSIEKGESKIELAAEKTPLRETLSDGSAVGLNVGSRLAVRFSNKKRRVDLRGEAFFNVAKNAEKPFVVATKNVEITVVGTAFNVDNRSDSSLVVVQVSEGRVRVQKGDQTVLLGVGEQVVFDCRTGRLVASKMSSVAAADAWLERRFDFDETPLAEVLPMLEKAYNVPILLKNKALLDCKLRTRFRGEPIERVIEVLAETFSLTVERGENGFILDGKSCD